MMDDEEETGGRQLVFKLEQSGERLDKALVAAYADFSRSQWQRLINDGQVTLNGEPLTPRYRLSGGEEVVVTLQETAVSSLVPENIPLDIQYEDEDMLVVNKPAGMVVHPAAGHESGTLVNAVLGHCPEVLDVGGERRPGIVHRLDKDTSGLIVVAKNDRALAHLQAQFKERTVGKTYEALVDGQVQPTAALIDAPIGRDPKQRKKMAVITSRRVSLKAREAQTTYTTAVSFEHHTLLDCELHTGRTHQIRVHLAYIGFPIVGDLVYGRRRPTLRLKRHYLHAKRLVIKRPSDNAELTLEAKRPSELQHVIDILMRQSG